MSNSIVMSRRYDRFPICFQNFIEHHKLWPWLSKERCELIRGFSVNSIEQDRRGHTIRKWQYIVNPFLEEYNARLIYCRDTGKQHLIFENELQKTFFILKWT